jgi:EAL domain-containing protein (putative c-di-GMP-specific phosphodiesterase class I)
MNTFHAVSRPVSSVTKASVPLCFLMDDDFVFRQNLTQELDRLDIDVVQFSDSSRLMEMVEEQNPDIVFLNLNDIEPHECFRALLILKECRYQGAVQIFGRCEQRILNSLNTVGADCALNMLPPLQKPVRLATIQRIILEQRLRAPAPPTGGGVSLADALARNLVQFLYLPKIDLRSRVILGAELVARVAHPEVGFVTPDQFLKGADQDDLLKLSRLALVNALHATASFCRAGVALTMAINISVDNLVKLPIADLIAMHHPSDQEWHGLILEVSERQVAGKVDLLKAHLPRLQQAGVSLAIDNFGRSPIALSLLTQLTFDEIKIDRSIVQDCSSEASNAKICKTLIQMAHNFDAKAVAVGIASHADLQKLASFDCDSGQGFFLSKPLTAPQMNELIDTFLKNRGNTPAAHSQEASQSATER